MKSIEDILKSKNITPDTKHHSYKYLYRQMILAAKEYAEQFKIKASQI